MVRSSASTASSIRLGRPSGSRSARRRPAAAGRSRRAAGSPGRAGRGRSARGRRSRRARPVLEGLGAVEGERGLVGERRQQLAVLDVADAAAELEERTSRPRAARCVRSGTTVAVESSSATSIGGRVGARPCVDSASQGHERPVDLGRPAGSASDVRTGTPRRPREHGGGRRTGSWRVRCGRSARARAQVDRWLQRLGELGGGLEPLAAAFAEAVGARVLDHEAGRAGERLDQLLVRLGERPPPAFSVRYRLPKTVPRIRTGTPRKVPIGGWCGGKPNDAGCVRQVVEPDRLGVAGSAGRGCRGRAVGRRCGSARSCGRCPVVTNSRAARPPPITPSAPYRALGELGRRPRRSGSARCVRSRSEEIAMTASSRALGRAGERGVRGVVGHLTSVAPRRFRRHRHRARHRLRGERQRPTPGAELATGHLGPRQPQEEVAGPRCPGRRTSRVVRMCRARAGRRRTRRDRARPRSSRAPGRVEVVDLEGEHACRGREVPSTL